MNKSPRFVQPLLIGLTGLMLGLFLASCASIQFSAMKDEELMAKGKEAWNTKAPDEAKPYWSNIRIEATRAEYLGYLTQLADLEQAVDDATALPASPEAPLVAAFSDVVKKYTAMPADLKLPGDLKPRLAPLALNVVRSRINANDVSGAKSFIKTSTDFVGDSLDFSALQTEMELMAAFKTQEKSADNVLSEARGQADFNDQIATYEKAIAAYAKLESNLAEQAKQTAFVDGSPLAAAPAKIKRKKVDTRVEMERKLRERGYSFKERIGEEFARVPEGSQLGAMGPEDILKFNESIRDNIEAMAKELNDFSQKYPAIIDKDMLKDVDTQKAGLEMRISQMAMEVKIAQDIASRGKVIMPLMIGLFNPQPGGKAGDQKSRPAIFRGTMNGEADYWWGMVSIPKDNMNDLVISVNDNRPVRVFAQNTKSGSLIESEKMKDLVNRGYKVGNSWPVLNAGTQLAAGKYFFELQKNKTNSYSGDAVVYSSFIMRMR